MATTQTTRCYDDKAGSLGCRIAPSGKDWEFIAETFASHHGCDPDDVDCIETDDGDAIAVRGERVGFVVTDFQARAA